ncbi:hypothetical protein ABWJ92_04115 [Streptomyces sp. NPDC000609]|uniref:hypothetical protein n=1 Tax=Streptomyces sp. NPDC000609 TaxID=3160957 RepID=UPI003399B1AE
MDNFRIPRLWRGKTPQICGERLVSGRYSNTAVVSERWRRASGRGATGSEGVRRAFQGRSEGAAGGPRGFRAGPRAVLRRSPGGFRAAKRAPEEPVRALRAPLRRASAAVRQPFLMRLVSSVTWL